MHAIVVYESMFGNTRLIADRIGAGLRTGYEVTVAALGAVGPELIAGADLLVVGGPTHAHGLSSAGSRRSAGDAADRDPGLELEGVDARSVGLRSWLQGLDPVASTPAAAFDTRISGPAVLTGRASRRIAGRLESHGYQLVSGPESFLVDRHNRLVDGEADRAELWGRSLSGVVTV